MINIKLDAVSLVMPSKKLYEMIYNRLGNDLLLWLPQYLVVKSHIYGEKLADPLHDDTHEFSGCFSGRPEALEAGQQERPRNTTAFPKDRQSGALEIHTDTAVTLSCNQAQLLVCLSVEAEPDSLGLLHVTALGLSLTSAVGLDKEPEISLLGLKCGEGCVKHGLLPRSSLPAQLHFNPGLPGLSRHLSLEEVEHGKPGWAPSHLPSSASRKYFCTRPGSGRSAPLRSSTSSNSTVMPL